MLNTPSILTTISEPNDALALRIAIKHSSEAPSSIRRFQTGSGNYVFEATFPKNKPMVVRIAKYEDHKAVEGAIYLSKLLRQLGVPLPELFGEGVCDGFPYMILERLPGSDLCDHRGKLSTQQLDLIAHHVVFAQNIVNKLPSHNKYGYSVHAENAPYATWSAVMKADLDRSRGRMSKTGLFDSKVVERVEDIFLKMRDELDNIPATPFLYDTTTKNVLVTPNGDFAGIVDVDGLCFGDPRLVPALTLTAIMVFEEGEVSYIDTWMQIANFSKDRLFYLYVAVCLVGFMSEHGQQFNGNQKESDPKIREKLLFLLDEVLNEKFE